MRDHLGGFTVVGEGRTTTRSIKESLEKPAAPTKALSIMRPWVLFLCVLVSAWWLVSAQECLVPTKIIKAQMKIPTNRRKPGSVT